MRIDWSINRRPETMIIPEWELEKTPEMQYRRELTFIYQETAFGMGIPLYSVVSVDALDDPADKKQLTDILPDAKAAILIGTPIADPIQRLWHRIGGVSMKTFTTVVTSSVEIMLLSIAEKLEVQGYQTASIQLPLTPTNKHTRLFELSGAGFTGKNHMVIVEHYGCRVNLGAVVTNAPLLHGDYRYDSYKTNECGDCTLCEEYCPSGALKNGEYDQEKCQAYINDPANQLHFTEHTLLKCDACMRVCPLGRQDRWDSATVAWTKILEEKSINY